MLWNDPAIQADKHRFALQWAQFEQNRIQKPSGTPISTLFNDNPAVVALMEANSIWTVEQLADLLSACY